MTECMVILLIFLSCPQTPEKVADPFLTDGAAELGLAARVADWARGTGDADAMLTAADLVGANAGADLTDAQDSRDIDAEALFDEAAVLARDDGQRARVLTRRSAHPRGIARAMGGAGPIGRLIQVAPNRPLSFSLTARGSEQALLHVGPTAGGELEVAIRDAQGRTACFERAPGRPALCSWRPAFTTTYRVQIRVLSAVPVTTVITSN